MKNYFTNQSIKKKLLILISVSILVLISAYTFISYTVEKKQLMGNIDSHLKAGIYALKYTLKDDFNDRMINKDSMTPQDYLEFSKQLEILSSNMGLDYIYSVIQKDGKIYFTVCNNDPEDIATNNTTDLFMEYEDASDSLKYTFSTGKSSFDEYTDQWGNFRSMYIQFTSSGGVKYVIGADMELSKVNEILLSSFITNALIGIIITAIILPLLFIYVGKTINPIKYLTEVAKKVSLGNLNHVIVIDSKDEIGDLLNTFKTMLENLKEKATVSEKLAMGDLNVNVNIQSKDDSLSINFKKMVESLQSLISEINLLVNSAVEGKLEVRGNAGKFSGAYADIIQGINNLLNSAVSPIKEAEVVLDKISKGDLTARMQGNYRGNHELIKQSINQMSEEFYRAMIAIKNSVENTVQISETISSSTEQLASGMHEQSTQTADVASAVEEISNTIVENAQNASIAAETAKEAGNKAKNGGQVVTQAIDGMHKIAATVQKGADMVFVLGNNSEKIGEIVSVINDIADQTNLLALNAAIEAARAGEQGRGFAVVADEVRKLAERTTKATKEIADMIKSIQQDTGSAVEAMTIGIKEVESGRVLTEKAGAVLSEIIDKTEKVTDAASQVAMASKEQSTASADISRNVEGINSVFHQSSQSIHQIASVADELNNIAGSLKDLIGRFNIGSVRSNSLQKY